MAELTQKERLQPSLLDRLTDENPGHQVESKTKRVLSLQQLRASVNRDLAWLLNSGNLDSVQDLSAYPEVARSVINFGMPNLAGLNTEDLVIPALEQRLKQAILDFEPRILKNTLTVQLKVNKDNMTRNAITFTIEGELWAQPVPIQIYLNTEMDMVTGLVNLKEASA